MKKAHSDYLQALINLSLVQKPVVVAA